MTAASRTAIGFRVKSGFAVAVVVDGSAAAPRAVVRRIVDMSDPDAPETRQPYHHDFFKSERDSREIARRVRIVRRSAQASVAALLADVGAARAALVVGSLIDPATVGNPHIRAHAREGQLFRTVLAEMLQAHGVACDVVVDRELPAQAWRRLKRPGASVTRTMAAFGEALGRPWRADEKAAALAAWMALA